MIPEPGPARTVCGAPRSVTEAGPAGEIWLLYQRENQADVETIERADKDEIVLCLSLKPTYILAN